MLIGGSAVNLICPILLVSFILREALKTRRPAREVETAATCAVPISRSRWRRRRCWSARTARVFARSAYRLVLPSNAIAIGVTHVVLVATTSKSRRSIVIRISSRRRASLRASFVIGVSPRRWSPRRRPSIVIRISPRRRTRIIIVIAFVVSAPFIVSLSVLPAVLVAFVVEIASRGTESRSLVTIVFAGSPLHRSVRRCSFLSVTPSHRVRVVKRLRALGQASSASRVQTYRRGMPRHFAEGVRAVRRRCRTRAHACSLRRQRLIDDV
mmetsp:Transcript_8447/g.33570  ORF Transcript_8447/g.33570 Transcript_8447/m.33570 type:complete len:269 (-) Transcript_8447:1830-2636(-)